GTASAAFTGILRCLFATVVGALETWHTGTENPRADLCRDRCGDHASLFARPTHACSQCARPRRERGGDHGGAAAYQLDWHTHCDGGGANPAGGSKECRHSLRFADRDSFVTVEACCLKGTMPDELRRPEFDPAVLLDAEAEVVRCTARGE